jgi:hypothetical protein
MNTQENIASLNWKELRRQLADPDTEKTFMYCAPKVGHKIAML